MRETPQQYTQRIVGHMEGKQPLAVQAATAKKLERLIKGVSTSKLRKRPLLTSGRSARFLRISLKPKSSARFACG